MTLSFSTKWPKRMGEKAGHPNLFMCKIHRSPVGGRLKFKQYKVDGPKIKLCAGQFYDEAFEERFGREPDAPKVINQISDLPFSGEYEEVFPKLHTIREDTSNRWRAGMDIHMVINNRTKKRFQFAPVVKCVSVQEIEISYEDFELGKYYVAGWSASPRITISGRQIMEHEVEELAINDGFDSVNDFFAYFDKDFKGKIIHWTDLKY